MIAFQILLGLALGYPAIILGDFIIHRYVWHGHWSWIRKWPFKAWLYPSYIHHLHGHHYHVQRAPEVFLVDEPVPEWMHREVEEKYHDNEVLLRGLKGTNHGLTVQSLACKVHFYSLWLLTPLPLVALALCGLGFWIAALVVALCPGFVLLLHINHRYFHMNQETLRAKSPSGIRWFLESKVFSKLAENHHKHHVSNRDDHYSLVPFGGGLIRLIYNRE